MLYLLYRLGNFLVVHIPLKICYRAAVGIADTYYLFAKKDRENMTHNLRVALGTDDQKLIDKHIKDIFRNFAKYLVDFFRFSQKTKDQLLSRVSVEGDENVNKALEKGKGVLIVSMHLGNWELIGATLAALGYPTHAIALTHKDRRINDFFLERRNIGNYCTIPLGTGPRRCLEVLKKNDLLGIMCDRDFSNTGETVNFFGRPAEFPKGPAFFGLKAGAPIVPTVLVRKENDNFCLNIEKPIEYSPTDDKEADVKKLMEKYISVFEGYIRRYPGQWCVFEKFWVKQ